MGSSAMALRLVLLLVLVAVVCQAQEDRGSPRQRLRALFNRRKAEGQTENGNDGSEGRSPFRLRRIRPRRPLTSEKEEAEDTDDEEEGQIIGVSSSVSTSSSSEVRRRPLIRIPVREEGNEVDQEVVDEASDEAGEDTNEVSNVKAKLSARERARLRFKKLRSGNRDQKDELLDRLLNNVNIQQTSGGRRRFRPSVDRSKLRKKTESAFNPARPASKFRLTLRRPEATTETQTTVTEEPVTVISVSAVTSRSETEARETFAPEKEQDEGIRTTIAASSPSTGVPTTERSFKTTEQQLQEERRTTLQEERRTTLPEIVTEAATVRRTTEIPTTKRPKKFDFSRSRLRPKLRLSPTTTKAPTTTTTQPLRTTVVEERRSTFAPTTFAPATPQPFQIRVEESVFDSFPKVNSGASSSSDVLKKLQLFAGSSNNKPSPAPRRPQPVSLRPAFTFPKPKEVPAIIEEELELENEIIDTNPFQFVPKEVRPAFVGVTTSVKIPKKLDTIVVKEVAREPIVFEVEETVRSIEQPKRPKVEIVASRPKSRRPVSSERRPASTTVRRPSNLDQILIRRLNPTTRRPQPRPQAQPHQQRLLEPAQLPAFNQIQPAPIKPLVFTPTSNFDLPKFFTEPFTFQASFNRPPGPGSYAYSVGL